LMSFLLIEVLTIMIACRLTLHRHVLGFFSILTVHPEEFFICGILELVISIID
jgi:hypothetical protein